MAINCDVKYGFFNLVDQDVTVITANTSNAFYPSSNIKSPFSTKVWRSTGTSGSVVFDFITTEAVDMILIRPDLANGFGFTGALTIEANSADSWGSPSYSTTLTPNTTLDLGVKILETAESYRYWRISATGSTYVELSNIFIGSYFEAGKNVSLNWTFDNKSLDKVITNNYGQDFITQYGSVKSINAQIKLLTSTEMEAFKTQTESVGTNKPVWIVMDPTEVFSSDAELFSGQFRLTKKPSFSNIAFSIFNTNLSLREYK